MRGRVVLIVIVAAASMAIGVITRERAGAQQETMWRDCRVEVLEGSARRVHCPSFELGLSSGPTMSQEGWLDATATRAAAGAPVTREQLDVGGRSITLRIIERGAVRVIASPRPEVVAMCDVPATSALDRCREVLVWMARRGLPPGVSFPAARLELLGRTLQIPSGCEMVGAERIMCPSGHALDWRSASSREPRAAIEGYASGLRARFPSVEPEPVECTVAGRTGLGARFELGPARVIMCAIAEGPGSTSALCIGDLRPGAAWPEPCSQVFEGTIP